jgi:hypothetical protein
MISPRSRFAWCRLLGFAVILLLTLSPARAGIDQWTSNGPFGGQVTILAVDPQTPSIVYAGNAGGGVFKSVDGGVSWALASAGITDLSVRALAIDPQTPTTLYAGTDQGGGVFKSMDGGNSWVALNSAPGVINTLAIDPQTPTTLYAASEQGSILKSVDGGATFIGSGAGLPGFGTFKLITVDPTNSAILYTGEQSTGLFKSLDGGNSWTAIDNGFTGTVNAQALIIDPQAPAILYAAATSAGGSGLFQSINGGGSWSLINSQFASQIGDGFSLAINPQNPTMLYAGGFGAGVSQSVNGGANFTAVSSGLTNPNVLALAINPQSPATLYAGTQAGVFATINAGAAWTAQNAGLALANIVSLVVDPNTPTTIYAGSGISGAVSIFKSIDGGNSWAASNAGFTFSSSTAELTVLAIDPVNSSTLYAGGEAGFGIFKSVNGGTNWAESDSGLTRAPITDIAIDPATPTTLYAGTSDDGVFKSTDGGTSWNAANNGLPAGESIVNLSIIGPPAPILFASTVADGVFSSTDGGSSWALVSLTLPASISADSVRDNPKSSALPSQNGLPPCQNSLNLWHAELIRTGISNAGENFFEAYYACTQRQDEIGLSVLFAAPVQPGTMGVPLASGTTGPTSASSTVSLWGVTDGAYTDVCEPLNVITIDPLDATNFYMGGSCGVLRGTNSGAQIVSMSLGLPPNLQVNALAITPNASDLYAGTLGGVYRFSFAPSVLAAAVLPSSRSVELGVTATAFATIANGGSAAATSCGLAPATSLPADFFYQTTAPATNAVTGSPNTPVDIPAGAFQTFVFGFTPSAAFDPIDAQLEFSCSGQPPVAVLPGINTLLLSGSATPVPDVVALVATGSNDGILHIMGTAGANAFALATINIGAASAITATAIVSDPSLPLSVSICQTNPSTGQCLAPPTPSVSQTINTDDTPTFAIFATSSGIVPFVPANNRIAVQFTDTNGTVRGSTSVAVETQ